MARAAYKLGFRNQKPEKKISICRGLLASLGKLPPEKQEKVGWAAFKEKCDEAEGALVEVATLRAELRAALAGRNRKLRELCRAAEGSARSYAIDVDFDRTQILAGGVTLVAAKRRVGQPGAPERLRARRGTMAHSARLLWKRPVRRCVFLVEATTDPSGQSGWVRMKECTAAKCSLPELEPGQLYWFRVAALNAHGTGPWSATATLRVD
jgi:hypothetical protein